MYTICTECHRQFRIRAEQLHAAEGQVMCGYCGNQFNALENLSDTPIHNTDSEPAVDEFEQDLKPPTVDQDERFDETIDSESLVSIMQQVEEDYEPEPEIEAEPQQRSERDKVISSSLAASLRNSQDQPGETTDPEISTALASHAIDDEEDIRATFEQQLRTFSNDDNVEKKRIDQEFAESDLAFEYLQPDNEAPGMVSKLMWSIGSIVLLLILAGQLLWFQRERVINAVPQSLVYYQQLCQQLRCSVYDNKDYAKLQLMSRDVRMHPQFADSILVNAVMVNRSSQIVAYPNLLLSLFDTNGRVMSYRKFSATEYLDATVNIANGMAPNTPIHFVLELHGTIEEAVSFEFDFY